MRKGVNKAVACALIGSVVLGNGILTQAAGVPLAGADLTIQEAVSANVDIVANVTPIVKSEYDNIAIAQVSEGSYVNIRDAATEEGNILGKLYNNSAATILGEEDGWYLMQSGSVTGYVKSEFFVTGDEAEAIALEVGERKATVNTETLYVRAEADKNAEILTMVGDSQTLTVVGEEDGWVKVAIDSDVVGYVSGDFVDCETEFVQAESKEEEEYRLWLEEQERLRIEAELRRLAEEEERRLAAEEEARRQQEAAENEVQTEAPEISDDSEDYADTDNGSDEDYNDYTPETTAPEEDYNDYTPETTAPDEDYNDYTPETTAPETTAPETSAPEPEAPSTSSSTRQAVASYALQFVGNPYVWGGTSLTNGADCSGFVMSVFRDAAGISLPRVASSQAGAGRSISVSEIQPGDLLFYTNGSEISHVAIYVGNGTVVHASTEATGIKTSPYDYRSIYKAVSVL